jgi:hypothetical protein
MLRQNDWCIFDNTVSVAIENALAMVQNREDESKG